MLGRIKRWVWPYQTEKQLDDWRNKAIGREREIEEWKKGVVLQKQDRLASSGGESVEHDPMLGKRCQCLRCRVAFLKKQG